MIFNNYKEIIIICLIIAVNSLFVLAEIAIITSNKLKLQKLDKDGVFGAFKATQLKNDPEKFLSTAQVAITLMSILIGFYSGSAITEDIEAYLDTIPTLSEYSEILANTIVIFVITYFTVLGEIIPKRLAMASPERFAVVVSYPMVIFMKIFYPFVIGLSASTKFFLKILGIKPMFSEITTEEIKLIVNQAEDDGVVDKTEKEMIRRLIHLSDMKVGAIMTPRKQMIYLDINEPDVDNLKKLSKYSFNYYPVINGEVENLIGLISVKELFNTKITNQILDFKSKSKPPLFIPEITTLTKLLELFREKNSKVAMVLDEYGEIEGIVTFNDILKTFIGDVATGATNQVITTKNGSYIVSGNIFVEEIMEILDISSLPGDDKEDYRTLASFILNRLKCVPRVGDKFTSVGYTFKVIKMEKFRIDKVLIEAIGDIKDVT